MMIDARPLALAFLMGMLLAAFYFGGLWWTVGKLTRTAHPWVLYFGSLAARLALLLGALILLMAADWRWLAACLAGFFALRVLLMWKIAPGRVVRRRAKTSVQR
jgi:F1F0 ATPase subunit 2